MGVAHPGDVFAGRAIFLRQYRLINQFAGTGADDVSSQDSVCGLIGQNFDKTIGFVVGFRSGVGHEGEFAHFVVDAFALQLFLALSHPAHFGVGVDHRRDAVVIDMDGSSVDAFYADDT